MKNLILPEKLYRRYYADSPQYSLVPQDNSAGNFVKVEQRVPVKIAFTGDNSPETLAKLRAGLNVECEVKY